MSGTELQSETLTMFTLFSHEIADETRGDRVARVEARGIDPDTFLTFINALAPIIGQLIALCKKVPPTPPPVPQALADRGVTPEIWQKAHDSQWATTEGYREGSGRYAPKVVRKAADELAAHEGTKRRVQKAAAVAGLNTTRQSKPEDIAIAIVDALAS